MQHGVDGCGTNPPLSIAAERTKDTTDSAKDYINLLILNRNYRLYVMSHICQHIGDWFVRIASLLAIQHISPGSNTALSLLVVMKTLPEIILSPIGGMFADSFDRRKLMIGLDLLASVVVLGYVVAVRAQSIELLYTVQLMRSTIQAMYEPVTKAIVPLLVEPKSLKIAVTLHGMIWSIMLMLGGVVAGYASAIIGIEACFVFDSVTYLISSFVMVNVSGNFGVCREGTILSSGVANKDAHKKSLAQNIRSKLLQVSIPIRSFFKMAKDLILYLHSCGFGLLVFMKASGTLTWASSDVLNASVAEVEGDEILTSRRMGTLFSCIGIGCLLGPLVANNTIVKGPESMQKGCILALGWTGIGWAGIANANSFDLICFFTVIRAFGSAIVWVDSTLLLQNLTVPDRLGRVLGYEYSIAMFAEAVCVYITGRLEDRGYGRYEVAMISSITGLSLMVLWSIYHLLGYGAKMQRRQDPASKNESKTMSNDDGVV